MNPGDSAALVTGGGTGLGAAAAEALAAKGAKVGIIGRRASVLEEMAARIGALALPGDVTDDEGLKGVFSAAREAHGPVRILVNAAGAIRMGPTVGEDGEPMDLDGFREILEINVTGTVNAVRLAAGEMMTAPALPDGSRGVIINVSSIAAQDGPAGALAYAASKGAVESMTLSLAREFGGHGIRAVTICPGPFRTAMSENAPPGFEDRVRRQLVFPKRLGDPAEFGRMVVHICENDFINGTVLRLDAGIRSPYHGQKTD